MWVRKGIGLSLLILIMLIAGCGKEAPSGSSGPGERLAEVQRLYAERRFVEAYAKAGEVVKDEPGSAEAWFWLGLTASRNNRDEEARDAYQKAVELKPDYAEAYNNLGNLYEKQENWPLAIRYYRKALEIKPELAVAWAGLADIYRKNGAWGKATECYRKAVAYDSRDILSRRFLEACGRAEEEEKSRGFVSRSTLEEIASLEKELRQEAPEFKRRGFVLRGLELPADLPRVPLHIEFGRDKYALADLTENARKQLQEVENLLRSPEWQGKRIIIEGHTCSCGTKEYNLELSRKRAETIRDYLVAQGVVRPENAIVVAQGEENPVAATQQEELPPEECARDEAHSMNRRVVIKEWRGNRGLPPSSAKISFWGRSAGAEQFRRLTDGEVLHSGDELKIFIQAYHPVHAYIFHHDSAGDWLCLFPNERFYLEGAAKNPLEPERIYWLPGFSSSFKLDNVPGKEEIFVYLSAGPDPELENLAAKLAEGGVPGEEEEVVVKIIQTRGIGGITQEQQDTYLPTNYYLRITFRHEP